MGATKSTNTKFEKEFANDENLYNNVEAYKEHLQKQYVNSTIEYKKKSGKTYTSDNPIEDFNPKDVFTLLIKTPQYYIRFGALLDYLVDKIIPSIKTTTDLVPIFDIDTAQYFNWMYSVPNQVSLDPRVCLVRNSKFLSAGGNVEIYGQLPPFRAEDFTTIDPNLNKAYIMNIYLNFNFIIDSLSSNTDERGDIGVYNFILSICDGLNKALGGVNNLEPVIDENSNILKIIDTTPIPGITRSESDSYTLQLYGYDNKYKKNDDGERVIVSSKSNFIRKIDLKTAITPEYATMITVGATAGGYVKGTEATAFSRWNLGLTDRFKEEIVPSNPNSQKTNPTDVDEAETNYVEKFLKSYTGKHGFDGNMSGAGTTLKLDLSTDAIDRNLSIVTEYYKYLQSKNTEGGGGTVGFIPFKLGLTMDGLSGIKIYNKLHVNTRFLPSNYGKTLDLIVTGVSHDLQNHDWETQIEATVIPKTTQSKITAITIEDIKDTITNVNLSANMNDAPLGPIPPKSGWTITHTKYPAGTTKGNNIDGIIEVYKQAGVTNPYAIVGALSVMGKESGWIPSNEALSYSKERLPEVWAVFSKTGAKVAKGQGKFNYNNLAEQYANDAQKLGNYIYGSVGSTPQGRLSKKSAQGNDVWGDGYKYRGRGFNQITFKDKYIRYSKILGADFVKYPDKLNEIKYAAGASLIFFKNTFIQGGKTDPIAFWNNFTSVDEALIYFANANGGSINTTHENAINLSRQKRPIFDIIK